jgi:hypothetical protein
MYFTGILFKIILLEKKSLLSGKKYLSSLRDF